MDIQQMAAEALEREREELDREKNERAAELERMRAQEAEAFLVFKVAVELALGDDLAGQLHDVTVTRQDSQPYLRVYGFRLAPELRRTNEDVFAIVEHRTPGSYETLRPASIGEGRGFVAGDGLRECVLRLIGEYLESTDPTF